MFASLFMPSIIFHSQKCWWASCLPIKITICVVLVVLCVCVVQQALVEEILFKTSIEFIYWAVKHSAHVTHNQMIRVCLCVCVCCARFKRWIKTEKRMCKLGKKIPDQINNNNNRPLARLFHQQYSQSTHSMNDFCFAIHISYVYISLAHSTLYFYGFLRVFFFFLFVLFSSWLLFCYIRCRCSGWAVIVNICLARDSTRARVEPTTHIHTPSSVHHVRHSAPFFPQSHFSLPIFLATSHSLQSLAAIDVAVIYDCPI